MIDGSKQKILKGFGKKLKEIRKLQGLSLRELSALTGVEHPQILLMEKGRRNPTYTTIVALADGLGIPPADLFAFPR